MQKQQSVSKEWIARELEQWLKRTAPKGKDVVEDETDRLVKESLAQPEIQERLAYFKENGCVPEVREFRDEMIAQGHSLETANLLAEREFLLRNGFEVNDDDYQ